MSNDYKLNVVNQVLFPYLIVSFVQCTHVCQSKITFQCMCHLVLKVYMYMYVHVGACVKRSRNQGRVGDGIA